MHRFYQFKIILALSAFMLLSALAKAQTQTHTSPDKAIVVNSFPYYHKLTNSSGGAKATTMKGTCNVIACCSVWVYRVDIPAPGSIRIDNLNWSPLGGSAIGYQTIKANPTQMSDLTYKSGPGNFCGFRDSMVLGWGHTWSNPARSGNSQRQIGWNGTDTVGAGSYYFLCWSKNVQSNIGSDTATFRFRYQPFCGGTTGRTCPPVVNVNSNDISIDNGNTTFSKDNNTLLNSVSIYGSKTITYAIENSMDSFFTLTGTNPVSIYGSSAFSLVNQPSDRSIDNNDSTTFQIKYSPVNIGSDTVLVKIANSESKNDTFTFTIIGNGEDLRSIIAAQKFEGTTSDNWSYTPDPAKYATETDSVIAGTKDIWDIIKEFTGKIDSPYDGRYFWGTQDLKNSNGGRSSAHNLNFKNVYVGNVSNPKLKFNYYSDGFDSGDKIYYELFYDDIGQGVVNLEKNSDAWLTVRQDIPSTVDSVKFVWSVYNDGSDYSGFDGLEIRGTSAPTAAPILTVFQSGTEIIDGDASPSTTDSTDFGAVSTGSSTSISYYLKNTGNTWLSLSGFFSVEVYEINNSPPLSTIFLVSTRPNRNDTLKAGDSALFVIQYKPTATGTTTNPVNIYYKTPTSGTSSEKFTFQITGKAIVPTTSPEISIVQSGTEIANGDATPSLTDSTDFGTIDTNTTNISVRYYIKNSGTAALTLSGSPKVSISGTNATEFAVTTQPSGSIAAGDSSAFVISFLPTDVGTRTATINITNNDGDEGTFTFAITGTGNAIQIATCDPFVALGDTLRVPLQGAWMTGSKTANSSGFYGQKGVGTSNTTPRAVEDAVSWMDTSGILYVFGGTYNNGGAKYSNALWKWESSKWTWISGDSTDNASGVYGTKGVGTSSTHPGARAGSATFVDSSNHLWLYGGLGYDAKGSFQYLNDMWKWDGAKWTWIRGDSLSTSTYPTYGTIKVAAATNNPGMSYGAQFSKDCHGDFWLFGGTGKYVGTSVRGTRSKNDIWKWDGSNWTFYGGSIETQAYGTYGQKGVPSSSNWPGARRHHFQWMDSLNNLWIYGGLGYGYNSANSNKLLNDLWKWDGNNWAWINGDSTTYEDLVHIGSAIGVPNTQNNPGARAFGVSFVDNDGSLWLMGGQNTHSNYYATAPSQDVWRWSDSAWTWMAGDINSANRRATFGALGVGSTDNWPGVRDFITGQYDPEGSKLYVFGGDGYESSSGNQNTLWEISNGVYPTAKIEVFGNNVQITSGQTSTSVADSTNFGIVHTMSSDSVTYKVKNPGELNLYYPNWPRMEIVGMHAADFDFSLGKENISGGDSSYFKIYFTPSDTGVRRATVQFKTSAANPKTDTFSFNLEGYGLCPVVNATTMDVYAAGSAPLFVGDTPTVARKTIFDVTAAGNSSSQIFYIKNTGTTHNLALANTTVTDLNGSFSISASPNKSVKPGDSTAFTVDFSPSSPGIYSGEISFSSNTCPDSVFTFTMSGASACDSNANIAWEQVGNTIYETSGAGYFGREVDISDDGKRMVVAAPSYNFPTKEQGYGEMYEYDDKTQQWNKIGQTYTAWAEDSVGGRGRAVRAGTSITISDNGKRMAIGGRDWRYYGSNASLDGYMTGGVEVLEYDENLDSLVKIGQTLYGTKDSRFGWDVELSKNGNTLLVGAQQGDSLFNNSGFLRIYDLVSGMWKLRGEAISGLGSSDEFGTSVAISEDGNTVAAGADYNDDNARSAGHARVFTWSGTAWVQKGKTLSGEFDSDRSGSSISLSADGNIVAVGDKYFDFDNQESRDPGRVRIYEFKNGDWSLMGSQITGTFDGITSDDELGTSVALSNSGKRLVVGAANRYDIGAAKMYEFTNGDWKLVGCEIIGDENDDDFGYDVAISGDGSTILIGNERATTKDSAYVKVFYYDFSPQIALTLDSNVSCNGLADGGATATVTSGTAPFKYLWSNGDTTLFADSLTAGTHYFTVIDAAQDTVIDSVVINEPAILAATSVVDSHVTCNGLSYGSVTASAQGGTAPYTYVWSNSATTASITGLKAGTYSVTITDANGCTDLANSTITEPKLLSATTAANTNVSCFGLSDASATASAKGGTLPYTYAWSNSETTATISGIKAGKYYVTITDSNGCAHVDSISITEPADFKVANSVVSSIDCYGDSTGALMANASGGATPYAYLWNNSDTLKTADTLTANTYQVVVTDANGCKDSSKTFFDQPSLLVAGKLQGDTSVCSGTAPGKITESRATSGGTINSGRGIGYTYQWQMSSDSINWSDIKSATDKDYQPQTVAGSTWYRRLDNNASDCGPFPTNPVKIGIYAQPSTGFTATAACQGQQTFFTDTTSLAFGTISSYAWSFGDKGTSSQQNPINIYKKSGNYTVTLEVIADGGCNSSMTKTVNVSAMPTMDFSTSTECQGTATAFTNKSAISAGTLSYAWDLGDKNSTTTTSPSHTYTNAGYYTVQLTATSDKGCIDSLSRTVQVKQVAKPNFSATSVCEDKTTRFTNLSTNGSSYSWDFGNSKSSSQSNPKMAYGKAASYAVVLTATSSDGCSDTARRQVMVYGLPSPSFSASEECEGDATSFTNTTSGTNTYQWIFGDGTSSNKTAPSQLYGKSGSYNVALTATTAEGCMATSSKTITVNALPAVSFTAADICQSETLTTSNSTTGAATYLWTLGDGKSSTATAPTHSYSSHGSYQVKLEATSSKGCVASEQKTINAYAVPQVKYSAANACFGYDVNFKNQSKIAAGTLTYVWNLGDASTSGNPSPSHNYGKDGTYNIKLIATSNQGCKDSTTGTVSVYERPTVAFTSSTECEGTSTTFTNSSSISTGTMSYQWSLGDGTKSKLTPSHTYASNGMYSAQLIATSDQGCIDSITKSVIVHDMAEPNFTATSVCEDATTIFTNLTTNSQTYEWTFGDGNSSKKEKPTHAYGKAGSYTAILKATTSKGCSDTFQRKVAVYALPIPAFSATEVCDGYTTSFTNSTKGSNSYQWTFGNGTASSKTSPSLIYAKAGSYTAELTATSAEGCIASIDQTVIVNALPQVAFTANDVCQSKDLQTSNNTTGATKYTWTYGDGSSSTATAPSHGYSKHGRYHLAQVATTAKGCVDSASTKINVFAEPKVAYTSTDVCYGLATDFTNTSRIATGSMTFNWNLGNGTTSGNPSPSYIYSKDGSYTIKLVATSNQGCKDSTTGTVDVYPMPQVRFTTASECYGDTLFTDNTTTGASKYAWNFGDGSSSTATAPFRFYAKAGSYDVQLIATTNRNCVDSHSQSIQIYSKPIAAFEMKDVCDQTTVDFTNNSYEAIISQNNWDFGDSQTESKANPSHVYAAAGSYDATLIVISNEGCSDTLTKSVTIHPNPVTAFTHSTECDYDSTKFSNTSTISSGTMSYDWNFGLSQNSTREYPSHLFGAASKYSVVLTATSDQGCEGQATGIITVDPSPQAAIQLANNCEEFMTPFASRSTVSSGDVNGYEWDFGDGNNALVEAPTHLYQNDGIYSIELIVKTDQDCYDTTTSTVEIYNKPTADFASPDICFSELSVFTDGSVDAQDYLYDFGDKWGISTLAEPEYSYEAPGSYQATLYVTSEHGCKDTVVKTIEIFELPEAVFTAESHCYGEDFMPTDDSKGNVIDWNWTYGNGDDFNGIDPIYLYPKDGSYQVRLLVEDVNGCQDTMSQTVVVWPLPKVWVRSDTMVSRGYTVPLLATGGVAYKWDPVDMLEGPLKANPIATVVEDITYTVTVANEFGCVRDTFVNLRVEDDYTLEPTNILTPDGNGKNDLWVVEKAQYYNDVEVIIFDRMGRIVYQNKSYDNSWDGSNLSGNPLPEGAYFYLVIVPTEREEYKGSITIFK